MFIDFRVNPAFFELINEDIEKTNIRHNALSIFKNSLAGLNHINNQMKCAGLDKLVLMGDDQRTKYGFPLVSNEEIKRLVDNSNGMFLGFASVDPLYDYADKEVIKAFELFNLSGLKIDLTTSYIYPTDKRIKDILEICKKYKKPVVFDCGYQWNKDSIAKYTHPMYFEELLKEYSDLNICLTQFGWPWCKDVAMLMLKYRNLYTDIGLLYFDCAKEFYTHLFENEIPITWVDRSLRKQILFASANPRFEQIRMSKAINELNLRSSTLSLIKGENAILFIGENL